MKRGNEEDEEEAKLEDQEEKDWTIEVIKVLKKSPIKKNDNIKI